MESDKLKHMYILLTVLFLFTTSCGNNVVEMDEAFIDKSFLEKEPCAPPCWYGLVLNESTEEDVYDVLKQLPFVKQDSIVQKGTGWMNDDSATAIKYECVNEKNIFCGDIIISKDKVVDIYMSVYYDLPLSLVIDELGEPEYISYYDPHHFTGCDIALVWPQIEIGVGIESEEKCPKPNTKINPNIMVTSLSYTIYERFALVAEENKSPWPGFVQP